MQVVSGLGREIPSPNGKAIRGAIQTDAAINSGETGKFLSKIFPSFCCLVVCMCIVMEEIHPIIQLLLMVNNIYLILALLFQKTCLDLSS